VRLIAIILVEVLNVEEYCMSALKTLICLAIFALTACKDNGPEVELLDISFASDIDSILDPATDVLTESGVNSPTIQLRAGQTSRFMLAGVHLADNDSAMEVNQVVDFHLYHPVRKANARERWDMRYVIAPDGMAWMPRSEVENLTPSFSITDVPGMAMLQGLREQTGDIIYYSVTLRAEDRFNELATALEDRLGIATPAAQAPFEAWYWVLQDRVVAVAPYADKVTIQSLSQATDGCFSIPTIGRIDLGGCDFDTIFAENPYIFLFPKTP